MKKNVLRVAHRCWHAATVHVSHAVRWSPAEFFLTNRQFGTHSRVSDAPSLEVSPNSARAIAEAKSQRTGSENWRVAVRDRFMVARSFAKAEDAALDSGIKFEVFASVK